MAQSRLWEHRMGLILGHHHRGIFSILLISLFLLYFCIGANEDLRKTQLCFFATAVEHIDNKRITNRIKAETEVSGK